MIFTWFGEIVCGSYSVFLVKYNSNNSFRDSEKKQTEKQSNSIQDQDTESFLSN